MPIRSRGNVILVAQETAQCAALSLQDLVNTDGNPHVFLIDTVHAEHLLARHSSIGFPAFLVLSLGGQANDLSDRM